MHNILTLTDAISFVYSDKKIEINNEEKQQIEKSYAYLQHKLNSSEEAIYGVNTGFGSLQNIKISDENLSQLQENLLITHAAGVGELLPAQIVKNMLYLKINQIKKGYSAVSIELFKRLLFFYNNNLFSAVHSQGSLGASGDLAPLSELFLPVIGLGKFVINGELIDAKIVLETHQLKPLTLQAKEALALINGTQFMLAHALDIYKKTQQIIENSTWISAASIDAFDCRTEPFLPHIHNIRPHAGQNYIAQEILTLLNSSENAKIPKKQVQDPYSFRCIPQVHGASLDALKHCFNAWEIELNSVTDNPNVFVNEDLIISGGNFHGQVLALTLDYAALALSELGNISERRTYLLISGQREIPMFLSTNAGLDSGYMIAQYSAASMVSQNKQLCTPASADSIVSSNGQEDHVSMGANAALKCMQVIKNIQHIYAIEWLCAYEALRLTNRKSAVSIIEKQHQFKQFTIDHTTIPMNELIENSTKFLFG